MRYLGKGLALLLILATPSAGQEVGQKARGELIPASINSKLFPTSTGVSQAGRLKIEGVLTSGLQLETEDGIIVAKDELINIEYFVVDHVKTILASTVGVASVVWLIEVARTCKSSGSYGKDGGWLPIPTDLSCSISWPLVAGLGVAIGIPLSFLEVMAEGEWQPW